MVSCDAATHANTEELQSMGETLHTSAALGIKDTRGDRSQISGDDRCDTVDEQRGAQVLSQQIKLA